MTESHGCPIFSAFGGKGFSPRTHLSRRGLTVELSAQPPSEIAYSIHNSRFVTCLGGTPAFDELYFLLSNFQRLFLALISYFSL
jgi:hypothetical protein